MIEEFRLPELGENIESGDVVEVLVKKGDRVEKEQILLEIETDKATIEVPSPFAGTVKDIHVKAGQTAEIGQLMLTIDTGAGAAAQPDEPQTEAAEQAEEAGQPEPDKSAEPEPVEHPSASPASPPAPSSPPELPPARVMPSIDKSRKVAPAAPTVRRFAREIGIDINQVPGTGPGGRISIDDVKRYSKDLNARRSTSAATGATFQQQALPDFSKWGEFRREKMSNIRKSTALAMSHAWNAVPHVTNHDRADITDLEKLRKAYAAKAEARGTRLTMTAILIKVLAAGLKVFPKFNTSIDMESMEVVYKSWVNIGVAVDTENGLLVPVIKNADQKNILDIAVELSELADKARRKKLSLDDMQGGSITITNLGGIGGTSFTPIINWPEVAILGVSRGRYEPVLIDGEFVPRMIVPLSLSYDHRIIDGADAARFLNWIVTALEEPFMIALEG